jgi:hypothetical protein
MGAAKASAKKLLAAMRDLEATMLNVVPGFVGGYGLVGFAWKEGRSLKEGVCWPASGSEVKKEWLEASLPEVKKTDWGVTAVGGDGEQAEGWLL